MSLSPKNKKKRLSMADACNQSIKFNFSNPINTLSQFALLDIKQEIGNDLMEDSSKNLMENDDVK
jgi:hypothetical protein